MIVTSNSRIYGGGLRGCNLMMEIMKRVRRTRNRINWMMWHCLQGMKRKKMERKKMVRVMGSKCKYKDKENNRMESQISNNYKMTNHRIN